MTGRLDEKALRRPDFAAGVEIVLGDGQVWTFPKPVLTLYPTAALGFDPDDARLSIGPDYDDLVDQLIASEDGLGEKTALLGLAWQLLLRNYALEPVHARALLFWRIGDLSNAAMWGTIADVALGRSPKPTAGGSAAS
jgi:hypothetical protein